MGPEACRSGWWGPTATTAGCRNTAVGEVPRGGVEDTSYRANASNWRGALGSALETTCAPFAGVSAA